MLRTPLLRNLIGTANLVSYPFEYRELAEILHSSLIADAFYIALEKSVDVESVDPKEGMLRYMDYSMVEARRHGVLYVPDGERFGVSVWSIPQDASTAIKAKAEKYEFILRHLGRGSLDTYVAVTQYMSKQAEGLIPPDAWYLSIIAVSPIAQGQGLGRKLMRDVLADADQEGVPTYLETFTLRNKSFYRRLGYRDVAVIQEPTTRAEYSVMLREPGCSSR